MNDLFILGAGTSVPYDFPSGEKLFEEIRILKIIAMYKMKN